MKKGFTFWFFGNILRFQMPLSGYQNTLVYSEQIKETISISNLYFFLISFIKYIGLGVKCSNIATKTFLKAIAYGAKAIAFIILVIHSVAKAIAIFIKAIAKFILVLPSMVKAIAIFIKAITFIILIILSVAKAIAIFKKSKVYKAFSNLSSTSIIATIIPENTIRFFRIRVIKSLLSYTITFLYFSNILKQFKPFFDFGKAVHQHNFFKLQKLFTHQARKDGITRL